VCYIENQKSTKGWKPNVNPKAVIFRGISENTKCVRLVDTKNYQNLKDIKLI
jgi:hypothetical protein